jgi:hypothetical protein
MSQNLLMQAFNLYVCLSIYYLGMKKAKGILRAEMARHGITYAQLAEKRIEDNECNLRNKVNRGKFTAGFLLQWLSAHGCSSLHLDY